MAEQTKVLILGGTGHFGARICRRLANYPDIDIDLVITSRSQANAESLADKLRCKNPEATISGIAMDQNSLDFVADLKKLAPFALIHTAGPYQGQDYRVANACIEVGSHYIDLADSREFVADFSSLDDPARRADVLLVSGASTLPALSSAVVDVLKPKFSRVSAIEISIAPGHQTPRGRSTAAAILSYCGKPFKTLRDGEWRTVYGWQDMRIQKYPALGSRISGACDVPDLSLLPEYIPGVKTVSFHAALEAPWEQLALWFMAWMSRVRIVNDWSKYAPFFAALSERLISFGSDRGGMHVRVSGDSKDGRAASHNWYLTAEHNHGPEIPCTPAIVLLKKLLRNEIPQRGATPCLGLLSLAEILNELSDFAISSEISIEANN
ncbi:MAG: saccharopine dehydrogenase NADP-binding domain-containing protein [Gammaproteobacteria bacterium]|nr:saccharopine dehydrogenase NADP-binding domain-containing protein [Gammaproteobacteria bacterium]